MGPPDHMNRRPGLLDGDCSVVSRKAGTMNRSRFPAAVPHPRPRLGVNRLCVDLTAIIAVVSAAVVTAPAVSAAQPPPSSFVVVLKDSVADPAAVSAAQAGRYRAQRSAVFTHAIRGYSARLTWSEAAAVASDPAVQFVAA